MESLASWTSKVRLAKMRIRLHYTLVGTGLQNAHIDLLFYTINLLRNYYPVGIKRILVVDLPWVLRACWSVARSWMSERGRHMIQFITRKELSNFIDEENLPDFLGGTCELPYKGQYTVPRYAQSSTITVSLQV